MKSQYIGEDRKMSNINILIVDGHALFSETLAVFLKTKKGINTIGIASSVEEAIQKVVFFKPDIVLIGIQIRGLGSIQIAREIKKINENIKIVLLSDRHDESYLLDAVQADIDAYIFREFASNYLLIAIDEVLAGGKLVDPLNTHRLLNKMKIVAPKKVDSNTLKPILSHREIQILELLVQGFTNKMIAHELMITTATVRNHIANIFSKLNCNTRISAITEARNIGIIS